MIRFKPLC